MSSTDYFLLLSAVYIAPNLSDAARLGFSLVAIILAALTKVFQ